MHKNTPEMTREKILTAIVRSAPVSSSRARAVLKPNFLMDDEAIARCWLWSRGAVDQYPTMQVAPHAPAHPIVLFFGCGRKRLCKSYRCVNPWHYAPKVVPPMTTRPEAILEAEDDLMKARPKNLEQALIRLEPDNHSVGSIIVAYRNLRTSGHL